MNKVHIVQWSFFPCICIARPKTDFFHGEFAKTNYCLQQPHLLPAVINVCSAGRLTCASIFCKKYLIIVHNIAFLSGNTRMNRFKTIKIPYFCCSKYWQTQGLLNNWMFGFASYSQLSNRLIRGNGGFITLKHCQRHFGPRRWLLKPVMLGCFSLAALIQWAWMA